MDWLKKVWKTLNEPASSHEPAGSKSRRALEAHNEATPYNFTPRAQQVLSLARKEAASFNQNFVGTEHLLLGLIALGQGVAVNVLLKLGLDLETVRAEIKKQVGTGSGRMLTGNIPYTPRVKKVLKLAAKEARTLNHTYVGTEHLLLGLLREGDSIAARVLAHFHVDCEQTRKDILNELNPNYSPNPDGAKAIATSPATPTDPGPVASEPPEQATPTKPEAGLIDVTQRYDVYCVERKQDVVVYRNVLFKGARRLFREDRDQLAEYYELKQANGQTIFVAKYSVLKFCEPGTTPGAEPV